jgi:transcriptional regulator GlxA family with amidase domain
MNAASMPSPHANGPSFPLARTRPELMLQPEGLKHPAVRTTRRYMEAHLAENISIAKLAALVSLSPYHFARVFARHTTVPPHAYLERIRIGKAQEFLDRGHTLASTAIAVGFADQSHLTHRFKRFPGITPGEYVRQRKMQMLVSGTKKMRAE